MADVMDLHKSIFLEMNMPVHLMIEESGSKLKFINMLTQQFVEIERDELKGQPAKDVFIDIKKRLNL